MEICSKPQRNSRQIKIFKVVTAGREGHGSLHVSLLASILFFFLVLGKHRLGLRLGIGLQMGAKLLLCCIPMAQDGRANVLLGWVFEETLQRQKGDIMQG